jgi:hypothetical protein
VVEADQQERGDRGQFPVDEQHQEAVGNHDAEHRAHEQQHEREEPSKLVVAFEVTTGIENDQRADAGDQEREGERQTVDQPGKADIVGGNPLETASDNSAIGNFRGKAKKMNEDRRRRQGQKPGCIVAETSCQPRGYQSRQKRQHQDNKCRSRRAGTHQYSPGTAL